MNVVLRLLRLLWHIVDNLLRFLLEVGKLDKLWNTPVVLHINNCYVFIELVSIENIRIWLFHICLRGLRLNDHLILVCIQFLEVLRQFWNRLKGLFKIDRDENVRWLIRMRIFEPSMSEQKVLIQPRNMPKPAESGKHVPLCCYQVVHIHGHLGLIVI
jgi:hypothetical protein